MSARFRIRTAQGQEISFASHEMFAEFVRSGDLSPDDVVYDAETREWSSARTHPVVLQIELDAQEAGPVAERETDDEDEGGDQAGGAGGGAAIDLDLAPPPADLTPEEAEAAFVARMEAERASERDLDDEMPGLKMERGSASVVGDLALTPPTPSSTPAAPPSKPRPEPPRERPEPPRKGTASRREERVTPPPAPGARRTPRRGKPALRRYAPLVITGVAAAAAVVAVVYYGPELLSSLGPGAGAATEESVESPEAPPLIASNEEALRARARERFLTSTQMALRGLDPIPDAWLRGSYLANPSDYPRVAEVWEEYLTTIREVRAGDEERYREAYLRALDDARVEGPTRTLRLAEAAAAFRAGSAQRDAHYDRVEGLATAALRGHDALVRAEGTIAYQPATGPVLSGDPVIEAVGRSPQAQAVLNQILDSILVHLHAERGPHEVRNVREWVWDGLLDAVTS